MTSTECMEYIENTGKVRKCEISVAIYVIERFGHIFFTVYIKTIAKL